MSKIESFLEGSYPADTYQHILQKFLHATQKRNPSPATIARLYYMLHPIGQALNNPTITAITTSDLNTYIEKLWLSYSADTVKTAVTAMKQFWRWVKKKGYGRNIAKKLPTITTRPQLKAPSETDIHAIFDHLRREASAAHRDIFKNLSITGPVNHETTRAIRDLFILSFLYESGARAGELAKLGTRIMEKSLKAGTAVFSIPVIGKTGNRKIYITTATAEIWHLWQQVRPLGGGEYAIVAWQNGREPQPMTTNSISQMLERRCAAAGIRPFRAHSLRHAKIKRSRRAVGIEVASELIDHSAVESTYRYANIDTDEITAAAIATGLNRDIWS